MAYPPQPAQDGLYRIKLATQTVPQPLYVELEGETAVLKRRDRTSKKQIWRLTRPSGAGSGVWKILSYDNDSTLAWSDDRLKALKDNQTTWSFEVQDGKTILTLSSAPFMAMLSQAPPDLAIRRKTDPTLHKSFVFERISEAEADVATGGNESFQQRFFTLTPQVASKEKYDIIIIGTGIGGGVLAADLFETNSKIGYQARKILVIEKGDLVFHSHCLNASRPSGLGEDRGQQNDTFFASFKRDWEGAKSSAGGDAEWKGGPMYCLGGRSAAWGLFAPRVHDKTLREYFPKKIVDSLLGEYYEKAEKLMKLSLPVTKPFHQHLIDRLNMGADDGAKVQWQWGRIASEFSDSSNFDFAEGAYSTIDKLLEIAMSKPKEVQKKGPQTEFQKEEQKAQELEHKNFKMLLGVEAREIIWAQGGSVKTAIGVRAKTADGTIYEFNLNDREDGKPAPTVIVSAGSVDSAAILLRSGVPLRENAGCRVTDHDIYFRTASLRYPNESDRQEIGAMKLQTYANIGNDRRDVALVNMSIDASTFLPRSKSPYDDLVQFIMVFILRAPLWKENDIQLKDDEPVVTIKRSNYDTSTRANKEKTMEKLTEDSMTAIKRVLKANFLPGPPNEPTYFKKLQLGGVAHELGTVPMQHLVDRNGNVASWVDNESNQVDPVRAGLKVVGCIDENLKLLNHEGVYVCDLSVFPYSPEANPTLTLAALSLRLSRTLVPRLTIAVIAGSNQLFVVNHSGKDIKVYVSNRADVDRPGVNGAVENEAVVLTPGRNAAWTRKEGVAESISVFRIDPKWTEDQAATWAGDKFWNVPQLLIGRPSQVVPVL